MPQKSITLGDLEQSRAAPPSVVAAIGKRFGWLTLIRFAGYRKGNPYVLCQCECGSKLISNALHVRNGRSKSCGCAKPSLIRSQRLKHGGCGTRLYKVWRGMIQRCTDPKSKSWGNYGGRGIAVCERWRNSFGNFLADMGEPNPGLTIERVDNDGDYHPQNCKWATRKEQYHNRRPARVK